MKYLRFALLFCWFLFQLSAFQGSLASDFTGCGGFIEAAPELHDTLRSLDLSSLWVHLSTTDGLLKDSVSCAPNGYYFLPVYDRGMYSISVEGPEGWTFDNKKIQVTIDENGCMNGEDVNFVLRGFSITGRVVGDPGPKCPGSPATGEGDVSGPAGILLTITPVTGNSGPRTTITTEGGHFSFTKMIPGVYTLTASHPTWSFSPSSVSEFVLFLGNSLFIICKFFFNWSFLFFFFC